MGGAGNDTYLIANTDTGTVGSTFTASTAINATSLDKITFLIGDTLKFDTVTTVLLATLAAAPADGAISLIRGTYTAAVASTGANALFTIGATATTGDSTMVVYDADIAATTVAYRAVILVGYIDTTDGTTAGTAGTTDTYAGTTTGLVGTA